MIKLVDFKWQLEGMVGSLLRENHDRDARDLIDAIEKKIVELNAQQFRVAKVDYVREIQKKFSDEEEGELCKGLTPAQRWRTPRPDINVQEGIENNSLSMQDFQFQAQNALMFHKHDVSRYADACRATNKEKRKAKKEGAMLPDQ